MAGNRREMNSPIILVEVQFERNCAGKDGVLRFPFE